MKLEFNSVTWYSKILSALVLIGVLPVLVFFIGREYQKTIAVLNQENESALQGVSAGPRSYSRYESGYSSSTIVSSGIKGVVTIGPVCPVIQEGSEEECSDKPFATVLKFINQFGGATTTSSNKNGIFKISLIPGTYVIQSGRDDLFPSLSSRTVMVNEDQYAEVELVFDSGIR